MPKKKAEPECPPLVDSVNRWVEGVRRAIDVQWGRQPAQREDRPFLIGVLALDSIYPDEVWFAWAKWVLDTSGLPTKEYRGSRSVAVLGRVRIERGTRANVLKRVAHRHEYNTPEHWAARLASSAETGHFEVEVQKFIHEVEMMTVSKDASVGAAWRSELAALGKKGGAARKGTGFKAHAAVWLTRAMKDRPELRTSGRTKIARHILAMLKADDVWMAKVKEKSETIPLVETVAKEIRPYFEKKTGSQRR